ncbi:MAG TPA: class I adenylate-forming enzyme family protein [Acidimicrobiales bacterium]|nr:class I adenylate-forming enzyme family protein [Acidimicrobiales bacterium]
MDLLVDYLQSVARRFGDRVALRVADGEHPVDLSYGHWQARSSALARGLVDAGVRRGDAVVLLVGNASAAVYLVGYMGVLKAGAVAVPVNPRVARRELEHMVADSGAVAVVAGPDELGRAREIAAARGLLVVAPGARPATPGAAPGGREPQVLDFDELAAEAAGDFRVELDPGAVADILYTSGTTGLPKGVAATHASATVSHPFTPLDKGGVLLHAIPLATFLGTHGTQSLCLRFALTNVLLPSFDAHRFAALVESERPGWTIMVPAHALLLLESGALTGVDTSSVRMLLYGSAPMPHHAVEFLAAAFPRATLLNGYGLTEGGTSVVVMPPGEALRRPGAVGRPLDPDGLRVVDDTGAAVTAGVVGEVTVRAPTGQRAYHNDPDASAATWRGEWVHTGDLGFVDGDGYLHLVDRKKDVIVRGGYNVSSIEVESALHEHPDVLEVGVVGMEHPVLGQDVAAVVRLRPGAPGLDAASAADFLAERVADYKRPRVVVVTDRALPRTAMGKLDKRALRVLVESRATR